MDFGIVDFQIPKLEDAEFTSMKALVTVLVGEEKVKFTVSSAALCFWSPFFKAACSDKWQSGNKCIIELPDHAPTSFKAFLVWIYTGEFGNITYSVEPSPTAKSYHLWRLKWLALAECWVLGDYLQAHRFCNVVMDQLITTAHDCYSNDKILCCTYESDINYVYSNTADATSPLRRVVVDTFVSRVNRTRLRKKILKPTDSTEHQSEVLDQALIIAREGRKALDPWAGKRCRYHNHNNEDANYECPSAKT